MQKSIFSEFGDIVKIPGSFGYPSIVLTCNPKDFEMVYRNDGLYPDRYMLLPFQYFRENMKSIFNSGEHRGLITERGESWQNFRSLVNPIFASPKTVKLFLPQIDEVAQDFIKV